MGLANRVIRTFTGYVLEVAGLTLDPQTSDPDVPTGTPAVWHRGDTDKLRYQSKAGSVGNVATESFVDAAIAAAIGVSVQAYSAALAALAALGSNGLLARTGANTFAARTVAIASGPASISNGDGVAGNPTITVGARASGFATDALAGGATKYLSAPGAGLAASDVALFQALGIQTAKNLNLRLKVAPGAGESVTLTLRKSTDGGTTWGDVALTLTIAGTNTSGNSAAATFTTAAGELYALKVVATNNGSQAAAGFAASCDFI